MSVFTKGKCNACRSECRVKSDQMKPVHRGATHTSAGLRRARVKGDSIWKREGKRGRESRLRLNGVSTRVTFIGRMHATIWSARGKDCGGWFAGRLHNAILRHNDCNALMHFRTVHWVTDWRCFENLFSRLYGNDVAYILSLSLLPSHPPSPSSTLFPLPPPHTHTHIVFWICPYLNNAHKSEYLSMVFDEDHIIHYLLKHYSSFCVAVSNRSISYFLSVFAFHLSEVWK